MDQTETNIEEASAEVEEHDSDARNTAPGPYNFPHEAQADHWEVDFGNSNEVYEGSALPLWILAGWAMFIIWAVLYLTAGVRTTF